MCQMGGEKEAIERQSVRIDPPSQVPRSRTQNSTRRVEFGLQCTRRGSWNDIGEVECIQVGYRRNLPHSMFVGQAHASEISYIATAVSNAPRVVA